METKQYATKTPMGQQGIKKGILKNLDKNYNENTKSVGCNTHKHVCAHIHTHTHNSQRKVHSDTDLLQKNEKNLKEIT